MSTFVANFACGCYMYFYCICHVFVIVIEIKQTLSLIISTTVNILLLALSLTYQNFAFLILLLPQCSHLPLLNFIPLHLCLENVFMFPLKHTAISMLMTSALALYHLALARFQHRHFSFEFIFVQNCMTIAVLSTPRNCDYCCMNL